MKKRLYAILGAFVFVLGVSFAINAVTSQSTLAQTPGTNNQTTPPEEEEGTTQTTCSVEKIGWILCPFLEVTSKAADQSFKLLADNFLKVETELIDSSNPNKGTFKAWSTFRDIANVAFVAAFLFLIYSQITGMGASNYGIKKMLPRLIIAAILVNTSYYICQILVDLTNILGFALKDYLWSVAEDSGSKHALGYDGGASSGAGGNGSGGTSVAGDYALYTIAVATLASAAVFAMLGMLGTVVVTVIVTCLIIVIILLLRKAIIILLIVVSPVAFVAYLLPNTEKYFSKWLSMFWQLLLVFPIVSLLFGAGQLASTIILDASTGANNGGASDTSAGLIAAGIAVAPLMAVYSVLKGALAAAGAINGAVNAMGAKALGGAGKWAKERDANSAAARGRAMRKELKQNYKDEQFYSRLGQGNGVRARYTRAAAGGMAGIAGRIPANLNGDSLASKIGSLDAQNVGMARVAAGKLEKSTAERVAGEAARQRAEDGSMPAVGRMLSEAIKNGDVIGARAAEDMLMNMGGAGADEFAKAVAHAEANGLKDGEVMKDLKRYTMQNHAGVKDKSAATFEWAKAGENGTKTIVQHFQSASTYSGLSDKQRASQSGESARAMVNSGALTTDDRQRLVDSKSADEIGGNQREAIQAGHYTPANAADRSALNQNRHTNPAGTPRVTPK